MGKIEEYFRNKNVLITGGVGFIGSNLAIRLVQLGAKVLLVDSLIPAYGGNLRNIKDIESDISVNFSDIRDQYSLPFLVKDKDVIFNLAGQTSHMDSMTDPFPDLEINVKSQLQLLEVCRDHNPRVKIVYASTRQLYGRPMYLPVDEKHPIAPVDVNGINKLAGEQYHALYSRVYDMDCTILRLTNTYGPRMRIKDARQTFLGIWIRQLLNKSSFEVWGGNQLRDYNYVEDVVDALLLASYSSNSRGKTYNLGHSEVLSLIDTAEIIKEISPSTEYKIKAYPLERKKIDIGDYYSDFTLFQSDTGWAPKTSFKEGMTRTIKYFNENYQHYL